MPLRYYKKNIDLFKSRLVNHVTPYALFQDKQIVFHASCVSVDDEGILFIGRSGAGKSCLAASLDCFSFISEDSAYVKLEGKNYYVWPSSNFVKVDPTIANKLDLDSNTEIKLNGDRLQRSLYRTKKPLLNKYKIRKCYFLNWGESFSITKMNNKHAIAALLSCSFSSFPLNSCKISARIFNNFIFKFVDNIDIFSLTRSKKRYFNDNHVIEEHIRNDA